jgi:hypothetical protein
VIRQRSPIPLVSIARPTSGSSTIAAQIRMRRLENMVDLAIEHG